MATLNFINGKCDWSAADDGVRFYAHGPAGLVTFVATREALAEVAGRGYMDLTDADGLEIFGDHEAALVAAARRKFDRQGGGRVVIDDADV